MTAFDYIIIILIVASIWTGFKKGLLKQLGSLAGVFVGIVCARIFTASLSEWFVNKGFFNGLASSSPELFKNYVNTTIAAIILFFSGYLLTRLIISVLNYTLGFFPMSVINRVAGALFTVFINFLLLSLFLNICQIFKSDGPILGKSELMGGRIGEQVMNMAPAVFGGTKYFISQPSVNGNKPSTEIVYSM